MNRLKIYALLLLSIVSFAIPVEAQGTRVFNVPRTPLRLLTKQFAANANVLTIVDPTPDGTPLTLANATGTSRMDGSATLIFRAGFTAPITLTVFEWRNDLVDTTKACWVRLGANAAQYQQSVDSHYALVNFAITENTPFLVMSSGAITGDVYTDAPENVNNSNTVTGYPTK